MSWFEVDRDGLRQLLEDRDRSFILRELVQNAWDEPGVTHCDVTLQAIPGKRAARVVVEDDAPEGFYVGWNDVRAVLCETLDSFVDHPVTREFFSRSDTETAVWRCAALVTMERAVAALVPILRGLAE